MNHTIHTILNHLFKNYGNITPQELNDNDTKMRSNWVPNSPFNVSSSKLKMDKTMLKMVVNHTLPNNFSTSPTLLSSKPDYTSKNASNGTIALPQKKLGPTSKLTQIHNAQCLLHDQLHTTKQAGFHSNYANHTHTTKTQPPTQYHEALINLTFSATANHKLLTTLANSMATINQHINQLNKPNPNTCNKPDNIDTTTDSTALSSLTTSITDLQQQLSELKKENANLCNNNNHHPHKCCKNGNYCWTHGYCIRNKRTSATCQHKAPGHQDLATHANMMGGSQANKLEVL